MGTCLLLGMTAALLSCNNAKTNKDTASGTKATQLSTAEKLADFDVAANYFASYYAPLKYKEQRFGVNYNEVFPEFRQLVAASQNDDEFQGIMSRFVAQFHDAHVGISFPTRKGWTLPFSVDLVEGKYLVSGLNSELLAAYNISRGDELVSIDEESPADIVKKIAIFNTTGYPKADDRLLAKGITMRGVAVKPASTRSWVQFRTAAGDEVAVNLTWNERPQTLNTGRSSLPSPRAGQLMSVMGAFADANQTGDETPYFARALAKTGAIPAELTSDEWAAIAANDPNLSGKKAWQIFASLYRHDSKNILLIRIPNYGAEDEYTAVATYRAILTKYQPLADVLVIDQTHNPGGSVSYVESLASLFLDNSAKGFMFAPRADRLWLRNILGWAKDPNDCGASCQQFLSSLYDTINAAQERGDFLAAPISLTGFFTLPSQKVWTKPVLLLIDELCASGGDAFPMIMKGNGRATVFGQRTMGAGGNVDRMPALPNSGAQINLTRSLFYLTQFNDHLPETVIENQGVSPDIEYQSTVEDFRAGYTGYVKAFSDAAAALVK